MNHGTCGGLVGLAALLGAACPPAAHAQECEPGWSALDEVRGLVAFAQAVYDDGSGPALYAGGLAGSMGGLVRWDGQSWTSVGLSTTVTSLAVFDDGTGPALFAGGSFRVIDDRSIEGFARWDGTQWTAVGDLRPIDPKAMAVYNDGTGPALYVAGWTRDPATGESHSLAKWDGRAWSFLDGQTPSGSVQALTVYDDGSGPVLLAGGLFTTIGEQTVNHVAAWDGSAWSPLGEGVPAKVLDFAVMDEGGQQTLFATGGIIPRRWDPDTQTWTRLADEVRGEHTEALEAFDDGRGMALFAAAGFTAIDGEPIRGLARWDGAGWSAVGEGVQVGTGFSLGIFDDGGGPALYVAGTLTIDGEAHRIARWGCDASCLADFDGDGQLTIFDFLAFQNAFDAGDLRADFDGDGELTILDFLAFQTAFDAGCE